MHVTQLMGEFSWAPSSSFENTARRDSRKKMIASCRARIVTLLPFKPISQYKLIFNDGEEMSPRNEKNVYVKNGNLDCVRIVKSPNMKISKYCSYSRCVHISAAQSYGYNECLYT